MTKMFLTLLEVMTILGKSEEEMKEYGRLGDLREFRDGPRLMYKADQVYSLQVVVNPDNLPPPVKQTNSQLLEHSIARIRVVLDSTAVLAIGMEGSLNPSDREILESVVSDLKHLRSRI